MNPVEATTRFRSSLMRVAMLIALVASLVLATVSNTVTTFATSAIGQAAPNLVANADFEGGLTSWQACGGAVLADTQAQGKSAAHSGRYAVEFRGPTNGNDCPEQPSGYSYMTRTPQAVWQDITVPSTAVSITLSFWYWVEGPPKSTLDVTLGDNLYEFTNSFNGVTAATVNPYLLPGWTLYRYVLKDAELQKLKGRTVKLGFHLQDPLTAMDTQVMRIDAVRLAAADEHTAASPFPADLRGDGSRPLAIVRYAAGTGPTSTYTQLFRANTDGSNLVQLYAGAIYGVESAVWSHDGQQLALSEAREYPPGETDPNKYVFTAQLVKLGADGSNPTVLYHLGGLPGSPCPVSPGDTERLKFRQEFTRLSWSPDGSKIAASIFAFNQRCNFALVGGLARIETVTAATGEHVKTLDYATDATWGRNGRWLFEAYDLQGGNRDGSIWEYDPATAPLTGTQLLNDKGFDDDESPVWSPDGRHFVATRPTGSTNAFSGRNLAIMLFDRQDLANPRMLLLADHGRFARAETFSPDGKYVLYVLEQPGVRGYNLWWLNVATGETGPITTEGLVLDVDWRPSAAALLDRKIFLPLLRQ